MIYKMEMSGAPTTVTTTTVDIGPGEPTLSVGIDDSDSLDVGTVHSWAWGRNHRDFYTFRRCEKCGLSFTDEQWDSLSNTALRVMARSCAGKVEVRKAVLATLPVLR